MLRQNSSRSFVAALTAATLMAQISAASAAEILLPEDAVSAVESGEIREARDSDVGQVVSQIDQITQMDELELRVQLELQAAQLEEAVARAESQGVVVSDEQKAQVDELAQSIREAAAAPDLKKNMLRARLLFVPRLLAQGIGYLGMAMQDLLFVPMNFAIPFFYHVFAGNQRSGAGPVVGTGAAVVAGGGALVGQVLLLGTSFPVFVGTLVPIQITVASICFVRQPRGEHTRRFCANAQKNNDFLYRVSDAGESSGKAVNEFFRHPLKKLRSLVVRVK